MKINKKSTKVARRPVRASEEMPEVEVAPEATELVFEAQDVAELIAEVTEEDVEVAADEDTVEFTVGEDVYTVEAEGDEEVLEATRMPRGRKAVKASTRRTVRRRRR